MFNNFFKNCNLKLAYVGVLFIALFSFSLGMKGYAQDTIVQRNNSKLEVKVIEVNASEVKYKRYNFLDGPTYVLPKEEIKSIQYSNGLVESYEQFIPKLSTQVMYGLQPDLTLQPAGRHYVYRNHEISEQDMLDIAWKLKDPKINLFVVRTEHRAVVKKVFFLGSICLATAGILNVTGVFSAFSTSNAIASTGSRNHSYNNSFRTGRLARMNTSRDLLLGSLACGAITLVYKFKENKNAHLTMELYNQRISHP